MHYPNGHQHHHTTPFPLSKSSTVPSTPALCKLQLLSVQSPPSIPSPTSTLQTTATFCAVTTQPHQHSANYSHFLCSHHPASPAPPSDVSGERNRSLPSTASPLFWLVPAGQKKTICFLKTYIILLFTFLPPATSC